MQKLILRKLRGKSYSDGKLRSIMGKDLESINVCRLVTSGTSTMRWDLALRAVGKVSAWLAETGTRLGSNVAVTVENVIFYVSVCDVIGRFTVLCKYISFVRDVILNTCWSGNSGDIVLL